MKIFSCLIAFCTFFLSFEVQSQCNAIINAPNAAIANCSGQQIGATPTGPGPYQYSWSSPTITFSSTTVADPFISSASVGWQTITLILIDNNNCTSTVTDSVQFYDFQDTIYQTYCVLPDSVCVLDIPLMQNLGWTYTDTFGITSTLTTTECVQIIGPGEYLFSGVYSSNCTVVHTYIVTEDCAGGVCSSTIDAPTVAIANCNGPQISATATGSGPYQYSWSSPSITFSSTIVADPYISSMILGWQTITLVIIDNNNCTSVVTDSIEFIAPIDTIYQTYCVLPDSVCVLDIPLMQNLGWTYTDTSGVTISLTSTDCIQIIGPGEYVFSGVYESNCTVIHSYSVTQDCGTGCSGEIIAPDAGISNCSGHQINATSTGPGPYQYTWSSPTVMFSSTTIADPIISSSTQGWQYYSVAIIDSNNCTAFVTDSIQFLAPIDTIYQTYCTLPDSVCVLDIPIESFLGWTYTDLFGSTVNLPSTDCVAIIGPGDYNFTGVYEWNCTVIHTYVVSEDCGNIGIDEVFDEYEPFIYPNPATSEINIRLPSSKCDRWEIVDLFGKICLSGSSDQSKFMIELEDIAAGPYFVRIWNDDLVSNSVIIKE